jgi:hypothetical protein
MINTNKKSILWDVLSKYDGIAEYSKFCDSLSNIIQDKSNGDDILTVYVNLSKIDRIDYNKVDEAVGVEINNYLFVI